MLSVNMRYGNVVSDIRRNSTSLSSSVQRLSSGERISRASDDVASLSISTQLTTRITSLRQARVNATQATSLLQVMDGALQEIGTILQRMNALATQSGSGTLTSAERGFLNQEFQQLYNEIDRLASETTFSNVTPLKSQVVVNGSTFDDQRGQQFQAILNFENNFGNGDWIRLGPSFSNNERFFFRDDVTIGVDPRYNIQNAPTLEEKAQNLVDFWNDPNGIAQTDERYNGIRMELISPTQVKVSSISRGEGSRTFFISGDQSSANVTAGIRIDGTAYSRNGAGTEFDYILRGTSEGSETGLGFGSTSVAGQFGGSLIDTVNQQVAELRLRLDPAAGLITDGERIRIDDMGNASVIGFDLRFVNAIANPARHTEIQPDNRETFAEFVELMNTTDFTDLVNLNEFVAARSIDFSREGFDLVIRGLYPGQPVDQFGNPLEFQETLADATFFGSDGGNVNNMDFLTGGSDTGVNVQGVVNKDFVGTVNGFEALYLTDNQIRASITVGEDTYQATITNTNATTTTRYRFVSEEGGYFDIDLRGGNGIEVDNQADADYFALVLDKGFENLNFYQERVMSNYIGEKSDLLAESSLRVTSNDFSGDFVIEEVDITPRSNTIDDNARIRITTNEGIYESVNLIDRGIEARANYTFRSITDENKLITFSNGATYFDLADQDGADRFRDAFFSALPDARIEAETLEFQLDKETVNQAEVQLLDSTSTSLFGTEPIDILTLESSRDAFERVQTAIDTVTSFRADVGASQQRFDFASANIESAIVNQQAARGVLADTDVAAESTNLAQSIVALNAGISVLSQANLLKANIFGAIFDEIGLLDQ